MIGPIDAIQEQSFPPWNSIGKVGFYMLLLLQGAVWWGCDPTRHFRQSQAELQQQAIRAAVQIQLRRPGIKCAGW
jgi:hypothetical protein